MEINKATSARRNKLYQIAKSLNAYNETHVMVTNDNLSFVVKSECMSIPDFAFSWREINGHYLIFQHKFDKNRNEKISDPLPLITIGDAITMCEFVNMYRFLNKNRCSIED